MTVLREKITTQIPNATSRFLSSSEAQQVFLLRWIYFKLTGSWRCKRQQFHHRLTTHALVLVCSHWNPCKSSSARSQLPVVSVVRSAHCPNRDPQAHSQHPPPECYAEGPTPFYGAGTQMHRPTCISTNIQVIWQINQPSVVVHTLIQHLGGRNEWRESLRSAWSTRSSRP